MHYVPENDTYVYFRSNSDKKVMVVINKNEKEQDLKLNRFEESMKQFSSGTDVLSGKTYDFLNGSISLAPNTSVILELK